MIRDESLRLTALAACAGCAAKIAPGDLDRALAGLPKIQHPDLLVGLDTHDDAGVFRLRDDLAIIQTLDFFPPIVDDPRDYGAVAAANALSDVYAMGGEPLTAMNIVGFPASTLDFDVLREVLAGGLEVIQEAGVVLVGGHSVKSPELLYGLSVTGRMHPRDVKANAGAKPGDALVLTKRIGTGVLTTALKREHLSPEALAMVTKSMRRLNARASRIMVELGAHGCTDVTGFGLMGHLSELTSASGVDAELELSHIPFLEGAVEHARAGDQPGGLVANRNHFARLVDLPEAANEDMAARFDLLFDPQTSGGLLIALEESKAKVLLQRLAHEGEQGFRIGSCVAGSGRIRVR